MPTRYAGFFCSDNHCNVVETYAVARRHAHVSVDKGREPPGAISLWAARQNIFLQQRDTALSNWPDVRRGGISANLRRRDVLGTLEDASIKSR